MYCLHDQFFTKVLFCIPGEMLNFRSCLARKAKGIIAKQRTYLQCTIENISVSIYKTVSEEFQICIFPSVWP